jgi:hypothetical protein
MNTTLKFRSAVSGLNKEGKVVLTGDMPVQVLAAVFSALDKLSPNILVDIVTGEAPATEATTAPLVEDIHPYDLAEIIMDPALPDPVKVTVYREVTEVNGKLYSQTTTVPPKGNKIS